MDKEPVDYAEFAGRLLAVELAQKDAAARNKEITDKAETRDQKMQEELIRLDEAVKGLRMQARAHNETTTKAQEELRRQINDNKSSLEKMITNNVKELYTGIDKIVKALGINDSPDAADNLRGNLKTLADSIKSRKQDIAWIRRGVITIALTGAGAVVILGLKAALGV